MEVKKGSPEEKQAQADAMKRYQMVQRERAKPGTQINNGSRKMPPNPFKKIQDMLK